jgi:hypothetical protein
MNARSDRTKRPDPLSSSKFLRAVGFFAGSMIGIAISIAGTIALPASSWPGILLLISMTALGCSIFGVFRFAFKFKFRYHCANCGIKLERLEEAVPAINYYCPNCNIEWETGLEVHDGD